MVRLKLKEYLEEKNISLNYIHKATGIRYATLHSIVNGKVHSINLKLLQKIMEVINVSDMNIIFEVDRNDFDNRNQ